MGRIVKRTTIPSRLFFGGMTPMPQGLNSLGHHSKGDDEPVIFKYNIDLILDSSEINDESIILYYIEKIQGSHAGFSKNPLILQQE